MLWYDARKDTSLLNISRSNFPFGLKGTTDVVILERPFYRTFQSQGLRVYTWSRNETISTFLDGRNGRN